LAGEKMRLRRKNTEGACAFFALLFLSLGAAAEGKRGLQYLFLAGKANLTLVLAETANIRRFQRGEVVCVARIPRSSGASFSVVCKAYPVFLRRNTKKYACGARKQSRK